MRLLPSCKEVQTLATEYREGALPFSQRLRIRIHLLFCWACRAFLRGLAALPRIARLATRPEPAAPEAAKVALAAALEAIRKG